MTKGKVLILAYDFQPLISIGAQRPNSWHKYFPSFGYSVTVVTRKWSADIAKPEDYVKPTEPGIHIDKNHNTDNKVLRAPFSPNLRDRLLLRFGYNSAVLVRKLLTFFYSFAEHLAFVFDSKSSIYYAALEQIKTEKPDVIIATGEPFILFRYASMLSQKFNIPWIADYRDGWTTNQGDYSLGTGAKLLNDFFKRREQKYLRNVAVITTAAPDYATRLKAILPGKPVHVVYNGYDEEVFDAVKDVQPIANQFTITYAGIIHPHQNVEMFLEGFQKFVDELGLDSKAVRICFYGLNAKSEVMERLTKYIRLKEYLLITPPIPYKQVVKHLKQAHVLLLLTKKHAGWLNAKTFDYLAANRPIILVENDHGVARDIIREADAGVACDNSAEVCAFLKHEYQIFKLGGNENRQLASENFRTYTRKRQAEILCNLLTENKL